MTTVSEMLDSVELAKTIVRRFSELSGRDPDLARLLACRLLTGVLNQPPRRILAVCDCFEACGNRWLTKRELGECLGGLNKSTVNTMLRGARWVLESREAPWLYHKGNAPKQFRLRLSVYAILNTFDCVEEDNNE